MHDLVRHAFSDAALAPPAFSMLRCVTAEPGVTVSDVARRTKMVKSHVSKTVDQLARDGYLEKQPDPSDHRLIRLYATPAGRGRVAETEVLVRRAWDEALANVPEEQLDEVVRGLRTLLKALDREAPPPPGR